MILRPELELDLELDVELERSKSYEAGVCCIMPGITETGIRISHGGLDTDSESYVHIDGEGRENAEMRGEK